MVLVTKAIVWSSIGARFVSQNWNKVHLADIEIFWGNQQGHGKVKGDSVRLNSCCCHHLPGYSPLLPSQTHWHQVIKCSSWDPSLSSLWSHWRQAQSYGPFLSWVPYQDSLSEGLVGCNVPVALPRMLAGLSMCHLWESLKWHIPRDKLVFWNSDYWLISMEEIMLLEKKLELLSLCVSPYYLLLEVWARLDCFKCACV